MHSFNIFCDHSGDRNFAKKRLAQACVPQGPKSSTGDMHVITKLQVSFPYSKEIVYFNLIDTNISSFVVISTDIIFRQISFVFPPSLLTISKSIRN